VQVHAVLKHSTQQSTAATLARYDKIGAMSACCLTRIDEYENNGIRSPTGGGANQPQMFDFAAPHSLLTGQCRTPVLPTTDSQESCKSIV
jgi:hypothetical protein